MGTPQPDRRRQKRFKVKVPAKVPGAAMTAETRDVSASGIFLYLDSECKPGSEIQLVLTLPKEVGFSRPQMMMCHSRVLRVEPAGNGRYGIAVTIDKFEVMPQI